MRSLSTTLLIFSGVLLVPRSALSQDISLPMPVYVVEFQTTLRGQYAEIGRNMADAVEGALTRRRDSFRVVQKGELSNILNEASSYSQLQALVEGKKPSERFIKSLQNVDGFVTGKLRERPDGIVLDISLVRPNAVILWQNQRRHLLLEWMNSDVQQKEAESLAAEFEAAITPRKVAPAPNQDAKNGMQAALAGQCREALPFLQNASIVDADNAELWFQMGRCQNQGGKHLDAIQSLTKALSRQVRADFLVERARGFYGQGAGTRALEDLDQALRISSGELTAVELRGDIWMEMGKIDDAVQAYYEVEQKSPTKERCTKLAAAYKRNGALDRASIVERSCPDLR